MKKIGMMSCLLFAIAIGVQAQNKPATPVKKEVYQATATKTNDLVHTELDASFDFNNAWLVGKVKLTLHPHHYPTNNVVLDAKGMDVKEVAVVKNGKNTSVKFTNDGMTLTVALDKSYVKNENYTIYISYVAKPNEYKGTGSAAITDAKGLYFINPMGAEKNKPTQVWTQGETEGTSVWVPTIDKPNQKSTQTFRLKVPAKFVSLSNGLLTSQVKNNDGTRTDTWEMKQPHAPYLFFIGMGDYAVVKDTYKGKEVSYYLEKEYEKVARKIFGETPAMMAFFSKKLGVDYPWAKYAQMTARDYVSGAMENTTATLHQESAQQDARELMDGNSWESTIAHELFHQWFGDYVTAESWSNLTVNESFANYSQLLWWEHKLGKDEALFEHYNEMQGYLFSGSQNKDLVRFNYNDKEDMFDAVSYNKGGRILHMLRNYIGDDAFFTALNKYLSANKFGNGSAHKLRMAFEEVTGKDLNWYFNQWYFGSGHPKLEISYDYNNTTRTASVIVAQTQKGDKVFKLPINIDVWNGDAKTRHMVWAENKVDTFNFTVTGKQDNINVDADKILLAEKKDTKTLEAYAHQYFHAGNFLDRREAIAFMYDIDNAKSELGRKVLLAALSDTSYRIRSFAINAFTRLASDAVVINKAVEMAKKDPSRLARAAAIDYLGMQRSELLADLFTNACYDSSYTVSGAALRALTDIDSAAGKKMTILLNQQPSKGRLNATLIENSIRFGDASSYDFIMSSFNKMGLTMEKIQMTNQIAFFLGKTNDVVKIKEGVTAIVDFRESIPEAYKPQISPMINKGLTGLVTSLENAGNKEAANFVSTKLPAPKK